jgi:apolipoprotein N-acyltransferase
VTNEAGEYRNSVVWWHPQTGLFDSVDKVRAIPLLESSRDFVGRNALAYVVGEASQGARVAEASEAMPLVGPFTLSPALCFEVLFPRIVEQRRDDKSVAIVNLADDSWVSGEVADAQLIAAASFRAIEQRLTLIRVAHGGLSVVIDPYGRERAALPADVYAHMSVEVSAQAPVSLAERLSILALSTFAGLIAWTAGILIVRARTRVDGYYGHLRAASSRGNSGTDFPRLRNRSAYRRLRKAGDEHTGGSID